MRGHRAALRLRDVDLQREELELHCVRAGEGHVGEHQDHREGAVPEGDGESSGIIYSPIPFISLNNIMSN